MYECMYISKVEVIYLTPFKKRHMYMYIYTARYSISYLVRYAPYFQLCTFTVEVFFFDIFLDVVRRKIYIFSPFFIIKSLK